MLLHNSKTLGVIRRLRRKGFPTFDEWIRTQPERVTSRSLNDQRRAFALDYLVRAALVAFLIAAALLAVPLDGAGPVFQR